MPKWTNEDTAKETDAGGKQVSRASHDARDEAAKEGGWGVPPNRGGGGSGGCFVATAVYGTPMAKEIVFLREFRDHYLLKRKSGEALVACYYWFGPIAAVVIQRLPLLKRPTRYFIGRIIRLIKQQ